MLIVSCQDRLGLQDQQEQELQEQQDLQDLLEQQELKVLIVSFQVLQVLRELPVQLEQTVLQVTLDQLVLLENKVFLE